MSTEVWPNASLVDESDVIYMQMSEISRDVTSTKTLKYKYKYKYKYLDLKYKYPSFKYKYEYLVFIASTDKVGV